MERGAGDLPIAIRIGVHAGEARQVAEKDLLIQELSRTVGLGGRDRRSGSAAERARVNVTRAIRAVLAHLADLHPALGDHLAVTVRTGTFCAYTPDPRAPITWRT